MAKACKDCLREFEAGQLSRRGLCAACGQKRVTESIRQMTEQQGPLYQRYKARHQIGLAKYRRHRR